VAAAFHRIQEAKAARLPAIALTTSVSSISSDLFVLQDHSNPVWSLGANLLAPLYRGGALKTQVEIRTAEQKQAIAEYAAVGLRAFGEVEGALAAEIAAREREQILTQVVSDNEQALSVVQTQFKVGSTDLRFVEQRQLALNATRSALIRVQAEQRVQRVNLHLALGGSFEPKPNP
jgi:outer membrane protein TolC